MPISGLSDYNASATKSLIVARAKPHLDLDLSLILHPLKNDVVPLRDIDAVKNAVKNLVLTNFFERPFQPSTGGNVRALLFENADHFTIVSLRESIKNVISIFEPRVDRVTIQVQDSIDRNEYVVTIGFRVREINQTVEFDIQLKRYR